MVWEIDPSHSSVEFSVVHLMIANVKGRFPEVSGTVHLDPKEPKNSWIKAQVKTASVQTNVPQRDAHLRSADFFDVSQYPTISFESTEVKLVDQSHCYLIGNFSLHGVMQPVSFQASYTGVSQDLLTDAWRVGLNARTMIDRREFGITFNQSKGEILLASYNVWIDINIEAVLV
jgi:polyisoprenoid-binding protein YceI